MRHRQRLAIISSAGLIATLGSIAAAPGGSAATSTGRVALTSTRSGAVDRATRIGSTAAASTISIGVTLNLPDAPAAAAFATSVSTPSSPDYGHYLTPAQWESRFSPTQASVDRAGAWLRSQGLIVTGVTPDRMNIHLTGTVAAIEKAFAVSLADYRVKGQTVRLAASNATVPTALAGDIQAVTGLDETVATPASTNGSDRPAATPAAPQPPGFRNPPTCSAYYGQKIDTSVPAYGAGYPSTLPLAPCGYTPTQFQTAYGLTSSIAKGIDGTGQTVAIVDAYVSPTLLSDAQKYYSINDPAQPLASSQFSEDLAPKFDKRALCGPSGWYGEQTLDVEAVHATAPGAKILYMGAANCVNGLYDSVQQVVDGHLAQTVTDSWGDNAGDLLDSSSDRASFDKVLMMAAATGVGAYFSSGDNGDEFASTGLTSPDYPPSSPWAIAVGGTSVQIGASGVRQGELGWSTSKSELCTADAIAAGVCTGAQAGTYLPPAPGGYDYGSGGGTSYRYTEPAWQQGVVPAALANRNSSVTGTTGRVVPDIAMDADPGTGMLVGETQTFPNGVYYDQYRIGGTSLASPLLAGVVALTNESRGTDTGFADPLFYSTTTASKAFYDVVPVGNQAVVRTDYVDGIDKTAGILTSVRTLDYQGLEQYCDGAGNCETRDVVISTAPGYDDMTGLGTPGVNFLSKLGK